MPYLANEREALKRAEQILRAAGELHKLKGLRYFALCYLGIDGRIATTGEGIGGVSTFQQMKRTLVRFAKKYSLIHLIAVVTTAGDDSGDTMIIIPGPEESEHGVDDDMAYALHAMTLWRKQIEEDADGNV